MRSRLPAKPPAPQKKMSSSKMSSGGSPVVHTDFHCSNLSVTELKQTAKGAKVVWVNYRGGPLYLQTPHQLRAPMGIRRWDNDSGPPSYELTLSLSGESGEHFAQSLTEMDDWVKQQAIANSKQWLRKNVTEMVVIETLYNPTLRHARDKDTGEVTDKWPPTFRAKIPMSDGRPECETYEMVNGKPQRVDLLDLLERRSLKGAMVTAIVKCTGIWFLQKFGMSWQVQQLLIEPNASELRPFAFVGAAGSGGSALAAGREFTGDETFDCEEIEGDLE